MEVSPSGTRDGDAFEKLFGATFEPMVRSLALACGDREVAADAVQDAFIRASARWGRISGYDDPAGWIRHVALNRLRDHFRRAERGRRAVERLGGRDAATATTPGATTPSTIDDDDNSGPGSPNSGPGSIDDSNDDDHGSGGHGSDD